MPALVQSTREFQALYPEVDWDMLYVPLEDLRARYETAVREGGGPSLLLGPAEWGPSLYKGGLVADLSGSVSTSLLEALNPAALGSVRYQEALIGLPYAIQGVVLYRNQMLIPEAPDTLDDLIKLAIQATKGAVIGAILERSFFYSGAHLESIGGSLLDPDGLPTFNDEKGVAWIELLRMLEQAGPTEYAAERDLEFFKAGKAGFVIDGTWNMRVLDEAIGPGNLAIDPWPSYKEGALSGYVQSENLFLNPNLAGDRQAAARKFAEFFLSPQIQASLVETGRIPASRSFRVPDPLITQAVDALAGGITYPPVPEMAVYAGPMDTALRLIFEQGVSPADALLSASNAIQAALLGFQATPTAAP